MKKDNTKSIDFPGQSSFIVNKKNNGQNYANFAPAKTSGKYTQAIDYGVWMPDISGNDENQIGGGTAAYNGPPIYYSQGVVNNNKQPATIPANPLDINAGVNKNPVVNNNADPVIQSAVVPDGTEMLSNTINGVKAIDGNSNNTKKAFPLIPVIIAAGVLIAAIGVKMLLPAGK